MSLLQLHSNHKQGGHHGQYNSPVNIVFRNVWNQYLHMKYDFYQHSRLVENIAQLGQSVAKHAGAALDETDYSKGGNDDEPKGQKLAD